MIVGCAEASKSETYYYGSNTRSRSTCPILWWRLGSKKQPSQRLRGLSIKRSIVSICTSFAKTPSLPYAASKNKWSFTLLLLCVSSRIISQVNRRNLRAVRDVLLHYLCSCCFPLPLLLPRMNKSPSVALMLRARNESRVRCPLLKVCWLV